MKKLGAVFLSLFATTTYALPVGNPAEATLFCYICDDCYKQIRCCDFFDLGIGFYGDYVFNRHMETVNDRDIDTTEIFTNAGYVALTFFERLEVFSTFGVSSLSINTSLTAFNSIDPHPLFELDTETAFSCSIGARATLCQYKCFFWGVEGQYFTTTPDVKRIYIASGAVSYPDNSLETAYDEWQVGTGISYRYNEFFVPYVALKYAHAHWTLNDGQQFIIEDNTGTFLYNLENQKNWGYAVGLTLSPLVYRRLIVTAEGRFLDETALYINAQMQF